MLNTIAILFLIASVLTCLFMGLFYLFRNPNNEGKKQTKKEKEEEATRAVKALTFRVIFSFAVFFAVMATFLKQWFGW